jgi:hypothetical protein
LNNFSDKTYTKSEAIHRHSLMIAINDEEFQEKDEALLPWIHSEEESL